MSGPLTTPAPDATPPRRSARRKGLILMAAAALLLPAAGLVMRMRTDPLAARLVGTWELRSTPSGTTDRRTVEFHDDGKFWIYRRGKRNIERDTYNWRVSDGELVVIFDNPFAQGASADRKLKELARRIGDPVNVARSYRYSVHDDQRDTITIRLIRERGNPPAQVESATLTREPAPPPR